MRAGNTRGKPSLVSRYRYPDVPQGGIVTAVLQGPEQVFRFTLTRPVANFGVVITRRNPGVKVEPRIVEDGDENRLTGYAALPTNLNPYLEQFGNPVLAAAAIRPLAGSYDVVFDSATAAGAGAFAFRFWVDDTRPPSLRLTQARVRRNVPLVVRATDLGSGIDATTIRATIDGRPFSTTLVARHAADPDDGRQAREAQAPAPGVRLPGVAQHGERAADPAQHARALGRDRDPLGASLAAKAVAWPPRAYRSSRGVSRSSIVGSASRSAWTLRTNSSSSLEITVSFALRFSRSRRRRASAPARRSNLGHSAATTTPTPIASSTIHGQDTPPV